MSISSCNLFFSPSHLSSKHSASVQKRNIVHLWRGVICHPTIFHILPHRGETIAQSLLSHNENYGRINSTKSHEWKEEQGKESPRHCYHDTREQLKNELLEFDESTDEYKLGKWELQPDLTVKRRIYIDNKSLPQIRLEEDVDLPEYFYNSLHNAVIEGNLNVILSFLKGSLDAAHAKITDRKETLLHVAVAAPKKNPIFIENLLEHLPQETLFSVNSEGETPLHYAAAHGNLEAARILVQKYQELPNFRDNQFRYPIHHAAKYGHRELILYLMDLTQGLSRLEYTLKAQLLNDLIISNLCDEAVKLFNLQCEDSRPLRIQPERCQSFDLTGKSQVPSPLIVLSTMPKLFQRASLGHMNYAKQRKTSAHVLLNCFCSEISQINSKEALETVHKAALAAAEFGISEVLEQLFFSFPGILARQDIILHVFLRAIVNRHSNVFNLLLQINQRKKLSAQVLDEHGNSILHLAAKLPSQRQLNLHSSPACSMQQELQWFKAVESITPPYTSSLENKEKMTPKAVFTKEHTDMLKQAKDSMNNMAYSGTTIATLFTTMAFSAATAVPGGNNSSGYPIFSDTTTFAVFAISDAISLFLSIASMMMFFSFFTACYEEEDFLTALPRKLEIGRTMLFFSTISMMVTFGSVFFIVLAGHKKPCVIGPIILSSLVPVLLFVTYHFPSLVERIRCTFRSNNLY